MLPRTISKGFIWTLCLATLVVAPGRALAAADDDPETLEQEVVGLEAHVVSMVQGDGVSPRPGVGLGGLLRLGRHRWTRAYFTPFEVGLFVGGTDDADREISVTALTETGLMLRGGAGVLELGLGAGVDLLSIAHGDNHCDGTCAIGGKGVLVSPVVRWLFRDTTHFPVGVVLRADVPLTTPNGGGFGWLNGWGTQLLLGFDVGVGT
jgi:hypothetical protein